jgi:ABC-type dipeptide/oligopeptide/nickel transport system ATPase subunit
MNPPEVDSMLRKKLSIYEMELDMLMRKGRHMSVEDEVCGKLTILSKIMSVEDKIKNGVKVSGTKEMNTTDMNEMIDIAYQTLPHSLNSLLTKRSTIYGSLAVCEAMTKFVSAHPSCAGIQDVRDASSKLFSYIAENTITPNMVIVLSDSLRQKIQNALNVVHPIYIQKFENECEIYPPL